MNAYTFKHELDNRLSNRLQIKSVISLYDYTGVAAIPWAKRGYQVYCFDLQHDNSRIDYHEETGGAIHFIKADLHDYDFLCAIGESFAFENVQFAMAFPVCTDLAVSGAAHFANKALVDPEFQTKAASYARWCAELFEEMKLPYYVENPVSRLATLWRAPDHRFHPFQFGGYIAANEAVHPLYPDYIAPMDAYSKHTCLWTGGDFTMPEIDAVECDSFGSSTQHRKLGGKSMKTKNIRSATPRGFAEAIAVANSK